MTLGRKSALELSALLESRQISAAELMAATLARIDGINPDVNAIVSLRDQDTLMKMARIADDVQRTGWLHGIPVAIKDLADVAGLPTSRGSPLFAGQVADADDLLVSRVRSKGGIVIGKTNTPEFGLGSHTFNPVFGVTRNPYDLKKSAGGSSGGAAAALATGMLCVADGSDMMGSLRNPAAWNNVYGMRPTWGVVPGEPEGEAFFDQLSTDGPMARSPADLAAFLDTISGADPRVPHSLPHAPVLSLLDRPLRTPRLAWLGDWSGSLPFEKGVVEICEAALSEMRGMGWHVEAMNAPFSQDALWESWTWLRSYQTAMKRRDDYSDPDRRRLLKDAMIWEIRNGRGISPDQIWQAQMVRSDWYRRCAELFEVADIIALPAAQVWPFNADLVHPAEIAGHRMDTYHRWMQVVIPASLIGLPVVSVPVGFGSAGLPMGMQLIGRPGADLYLLQLAELWHRATEWPQKRPAMVSCGQSGRRESQ